MADDKGPRWVEVAQFGAIYEAEIAAGRLESAGIMSRIDRGGAVGIFGPGHTGTSLHGVTLYVPDDQLDAAREALDVVDDT